MRTPLDFALFYARCGYSVLPVRLDGTKAPALKVWEPYQKTAATTATIKQWFSGGRPPGIGLVQGAVSGNAEMLECETEAALVELEQHIRDHERADLLERLNLRVRSGGGGLHFYYRMAETPPDPGGQKLARFADSSTKIETRAEGNQVVAPGSPLAVHKSGKPYELLSGSFAEVPVLSLADRAFLFDMARLCNEFEERKVRYHAPPSTPRSGGGKRPGEAFNEQATNADVWPILERAGWSIVRDRGDVLYLARPGKDARDGHSATLGAVAPGVLYVFSSSAAPFESNHGYKPYSVYGLLECGGDFKRAFHEIGAKGYGEYVPQEEFDQQVKGERKQPRVPSDATPPTFEDAVRPRPLTVDLLPVPPFDAEKLLPLAWRSWLVDVSERMNTPIEYGAAAVVVAAATLVGGKLCIRPKRKDDWTVTPNLWGAVVGPAGILKSPTTGEALRHLHRQEAAALERAKVEREEWQADVKVRRAKAASAEATLKKMAKEGSTDADLKKYALENLGGDEDEDLKGPPVRRYIINDATVEKLGEILADNPQGLLLYRDELTGFFNTLQKQGHETDRQFFLEAWNGDKSYTFDRIKRGTVTIPRVCLSLFGTIQPGPLARHIRATAEEADGLAQRFQVLVYPDLSSEFVHVDREPDTAAREKADASFDRLASIVPAAIGAEIDGDTAYLRFSEEAQAVFDGWYVPLEQRLRAPEDSSAFESHLSKYRSLMPSLALLFHLVDGGSGPVGAEAARRAIDWCALLHDHAKRVYHAAVDSDPTAAQALADRIKASLPNPFTPRDVVRKGWAELSTMDDVDRAIGLLEDRGWVKVVEEAPGEKGGRPSTKVYINPAVQGSVGFVSGSTHRSVQKRGGATTETTESVQENKLTKLTKPYIHDTYEDGEGEKFSPSMGSGTDKTDKTPPLVLDLDGTSALLPDGSENSQPSQTPASPATRATL